MNDFCIVLLSVLAALGIALSLLELVRVMRARGNEYICVCFDERYLSGECLPDMLIICRTCAEQEEILNRICSREGRSVYIRKL